MYAGPRLLAVADGMGGMAAGDVASNIVIAAIWQEIVQGHELHSFPTFGYWAKGVAITGILEIAAIMIVCVAPTETCGKRTREPFNPPGAFATT